MIWEWLDLKLQDDIPLTIYFEIGNTKKKIEDLLHITKGTLYRLENSTKIRYVLCWRMKRLEPERF